MHFCMSQYDNLFGTARVPLAGKDGQTLLAKDPKHRQHIIVAHNNSVSRTSKGEGGLDEDKKR